MISGHLMVWYRLVPLPSCRQYKVGDTSAIHGIVRSPFNGKSSIPTRKNNAAHIKANTQHIIQHFQATDRPLSLYLKHIRQLTRSNPRV